MRLRERIEGFGIALDTVQLPTNAGGHPNDPPVPADKGFRGVHRVMGNVEGLKRFVSIRESPYHGLNFCQGSATSPRSSNS